MTYQDMVFELIQRGETSREKMAAHTGLTVKQVERAVNNLATAKRIEFVSQASAGWHKGTQPAIYRVTVERDAAPVRARVNSVWQLGAT